MKLAIAIFRYFPFGGLQRDMRSIAEEAIARGHQVTIFCGDWQGDMIVGADTKVIDTFVWFNVAGVQRFVKAFERIYDPEQFDVLLGFNKMPSLDVYFAGDTCFAEKAFKKRGWLYRLAPRTRLYLAYEAAVFAAQSKTRILSLVDKEQKNFMHFYGTGQDRFFSLPPSVDLNHVACANPESAREQLLDRFKLNRETKILICIGSDFYRKGVDIAINVLAQLDNREVNAVLMIVGQGDAESYRQQATTMGLSNKVFFLGSCSPVGNFLHAADAVLHLAREELAGNVIIEAMASARPVLVTDVCGYAGYVSRYEMGRVVASPVDVTLAARELNDLLLVDKSYWLSASHSFRDQENAFSRSKLVVDFLETV
jgi:UDP-glucose:(heptosyl)LPS alpha-1,3-glucosyltransferase